MTTTYPVKVKRKRAPRPSTRTLALKHGAWGADGYSTTAYVRRLLSLLEGMVPDSDDAEANR